MRTIQHIHFIEWVAGGLFYSVKWTIYTYVIPGTSDLLRYLNYKNHFIYNFYLYDLVWRLWRLWAFFSIHWQIVSHKVVSSTTPHQTLVAIVTDQKGCHTIVTKAAMTCQHEEILKCYYILIFLGVQLILINRNTQSYWVHPNISGVET